MVAGAGVGIDAEALAHHAAAAFHLLACQRAFSPLLIEHAFGLGDDDLRALGRGGQRLSQRIPHLGDIVGAGERAHPSHADAAHRLLDRVPGGADRVVGGGREHVLSAGGGGIAVVDHDHHVVALVEHGIADARGETVVPEAAVAHERDGALTSHRIERGRARAAEAVAHR